MPDNIGQMFYCGERPWHKKGTKLSEAATAEQAILAGGLDWEVDMIPIQTVEDPPTQTDRRMAVVRTDRKPGDLRRVLGVVHPDFEPLQNRDGVMVFDKLVGKRQHVAARLGRQRRRREGGRLRIGVEAHHSPPKHAARNSVETVDGAVDGRQLQHFPRHRMQGVPENEDRHRQPANP